MAELLARKRQLAAAIEDVPGTFQSADLAANGDAKDFADFNLRAPSWSPTTLSFDRELKTPSLTPVKQHRPGVTAVEISFSTEMARHVTLFETPPTWRLMQACGFENNQVRGFAGTVNNVAGRVMFHKENLTTGGQGGGTGNGLNYGSYYTAAGSDDFKVYVGTGESFLATDVLTGDDSGETFTTSARNASLNRALSPVSDPDTVDSLSMVYFVDGKALSLKGARGNVELQFRHGNIVTANFTFQAILHSYVDRALMTGTDRPSINEQDPAFFLGSDMQIADEDGQNDYDNLIHHDITINMNNTAVLREDSSLGTGWTAAIVPDRAPTLTMNVDEDMNTAYDFRARMESGVPYGIKFGANGKAAGTGDGFRFRIPGAQITSAEPSERDAVTTWDLEMLLTGGGYTDASGNSVTGEDSEIVIINI